MSDSFHNKTKIAKSFSLNFRRFLILLLIVEFSNCLIIEFATAQSPNAISYQAVARDNAGNLMASQTISLRFSIHNLTATGTVVYAETKSTTTNTLGLFSINIGEGTPVTGTLAGVNWIGAKFIQVEMDATGGTSYVNMGTMQLMSVPYSLYAAKSGNLPDGTANGNTLHWNGTVWVADNVIYNNGTNVGVGTTTPATKLDVAGTTKTTNLQMTTGAAAGNVLQSDASGNASWVNPNTLSLTETDPQVSSVTTNKIPKWNGTTLTDGVITDIGSGFVGINNTSPATQLDIAGAGGIRLLSGNATFNTTIGIGRTATDGLLGVAGSAGQFMADAQAGDITFRTELPASKFLIRAGGNSSNATMAVSGNKVGIGTSSPTTLLDVAGTTKTTNLQMATGAGVNKVLQSDASGNASWVNSTSLSITELDPQVGTLTLNKMPKWNGTTLADGQIFDNGTNIGIGTTTPAAKLDVAGTTKTSNLQMTTGAAAGNVLQSDASGNASWVNANTLTVTETDPKVGTLTTNKIPKWNGSTLTNGILSDDGTNIGVGITTPTGRLHVKSSANSTNPLYLENSASATPLFKVLQSASGNANVGIYNSAGTEQIRFNSNNDSWISNNLGIGNTAPATELDVTGTTKTTNFKMTSGAANGKVLQSDASGNASWVNSNTLAISESDPKVGSLNSNYIPKWNGTTLANGQVFDNGTNVGIGTTSPTTKFQIGDYVTNGNNTYLSIKTQGGNLYKAGIGLYHFNDSIGWLMESDEILNTFTLHRRNGPTFNYAALTVSHVGNVGIGTTTPFNKLDVEGGLAVGSAYSGTTTAPTNGAIIQGNVGIGTTTPTAALEINSFSFKHSNAGKSVESQLFANDAFFGTTTANYNFHLTAGGFDDMIIRGDNHRIGFGRNPTNQKFEVEGGGYFNGNVGIGTATPGGLLELGLDQGRKPSTNTWTITSDARLKNIDGSYTKGLNEIMQLKPISYHYKNANGRTFSEEILKTQSVGFSAQEVQKIFPECVGQDADGYLNLNIHAILVAQVNAIQELKTELDKKDIQLTSLQLQINELKALMKK